MSIDLAHATPELLHYLATQPVRNPPPGLTSNFVNPVTNGSPQIWSSSILLFVTVLVYSNRMFIKLQYTTWAWDDVTLSIAMILLIGEFSVKTYGVAIGLLGHHAWDVPILRYLQPSATHFYYTITVSQPWTKLFIRVTFFILYLHLFDQVRWAKLCSRFGLVFVIVSHTIIGIAFFVYTNSNDCTKWFNVTIKIGITLGCVGLLCDITIFIIPFLVIAPLNMCYKKKWGAGFIFLTGACGVFCSILNIYYRCWLRSSQDWAWDAIPANVVVLAEGCIGIICASIPSLAFGFRHPGSIYQRIFRLRSTLTTPGDTPRHKPDNSKKGFEWFSTSLKPGTWSQMLPKITQSCAGSDRTLQDLEMAAEPVYVPNDRTP